MTVTINISRGLYFTVSHFNCLQDFIYPENVAYPIGGPNDKQFAVIQIHYNNPDKVSGTIIIHL